MWKKATEVWNEKLKNHVKNLKPELHLLSIALTNHTNPVLNEKRENCWNTNDLSYFQKEQINFLSLTKFVQDVLKHEKTFTVMLTGDDPLLYYYFKELASFFYQNNLKSVLLTTTHKSEKMPA